MCFCNPLQYKHPGIWRRPFEPPLLEDYVVIIWGPEAETVAHDRGYVNVLPPAGLTTGFGTEADRELGRYYRKTFPDREKAGIELVELDLIGVKIDYDNTVTRRELEKAKDKKTLMNTRPPDLQASIERREKMKIDKQKRRVRIAGAAGLVRPPNEQHVLRRVEEALKRIEEGTYGKCEGCGKAIRQGRLRALPLVTTCVNCQEKGEAGGGH